MSNIDTILEILKQGNVLASSFDLNEKKHGHKGKCLYIKQGQDEVFIDFDEHGNIIKNN